MFQEIGNVRRIGEFFPMSVLMVLMVLIGPRPPNSNALRPTGFARSRTRRENRGRARTRCPIERKTRNGQTHQIHGPPHF